ncbi:MAG: ribonuclease HII [Oscillospiraceae bacterium]|nr:ribonuclease HII [Oscillospiraceae bacterium]
MNHVYERQARAKGYYAVCGVDEAGVGPLAGDVYAAAVILPSVDDCQALSLDGLDDSKKLTPKKRLALSQRIQGQAIAWSVSTASVQEIDQFNIRGATRLAMQRAIEALQPSADYAIIDGNYNFELPLPYQAIVKGDTLSLSIAAASILAKVARDIYMHKLHEVYPVYGFDRHKGYPTKAHYTALQAYGASPAHRRSFRLS